ncbi:MAG: ABC transporter permease [Actinomycetota bacterium]
MSAQISSSGVAFGRRTAAAVLASPVLTLLAFFAAPLIYLTWVSFTHADITGDGSFTLDNYTEVLGEPIYRSVFIDTIFITVTAMLILFVVAFPIASFLAFRAGKWEIPMLLALVLTDELNPLIRLYAWQIVMNKEGVINKLLQGLGVIEQPLTILFTKTAVIIVLATGSLAFVVIPIYAALKTVNRSLIEAARDLGASWFTILREVLLPLSATGFIAAIIIVFVPMLSDFASPAVVGGREGYMIASLIEEEFNARGDWGVGSALSFVVLAISSLMVWLSIKISKVGRLQA